MSNPQSQEESWEKRFDKRFVDTDQEDWWQTSYDFPDTATPSKVKSFISSEIDKAVAKERAKFRQGIIQAGKHFNGEKINGVWTWPKKFSQVETRQDYRTQQILKYLEDFLDSLSSTQSKGDEK